MRRPFRFIFLPLFLNLIQIEGGEAQDAVFAEPSPLEPQLRQRLYAQRSARVKRSQMQGSAAQEGQTATSGGDELIQDPELDGLAHGPAADIDVESARRPAPPAGEIKLLLRSRFAADIEWQEREEIWEATQLFLIETNLRTSERLRFSAGIRARHQFAALQSDTAEADSPRFELDAAPTAGYVDTTVTDGLHLRAGYQMLYLGRMDVFSATNFLTALDLRNGPTTMPEAAEFAQLALRIDADPLSWLSLRLIYLPFYQSHLVSTTESDYAQYPASRVEEVFRHIVGEPGASSEMDEIRRFFKEIVSRSARSKSVDSNNATFFPEPDLTHPQGALRFTLHGPQGELGLTTGTAIERLPASYISPETIELIRTGGSGSESPDAQLPPLDADAPPVEVFYNRFYLFSLDGATDLGPLQVGVEAAYQLDRTLLSVKRDFWPRNLGYFDALLQPDAWPIPGRTDILQLVLHGEFIEDSEWVIALEGVFAYAIYIPYERDREWLSLHRGRYLIGGAAHLSWSPKESGWTFEANSVVTNGLIYLVAPRIECRLISELYAELGAFLVGSSAASGSYIDQELIMGYLYEGIDQVFVGLRYSP
ncbi:MAG: hypothetical protein JXA30_09315 [Deltaproteobacteria bacterium]|nr:hypothetical protein [Deltaproteobacteria bacterium]